MYVEEADIRLVLFEPCHGLTSVPRLRPDLQPDEEIVAVAVHGDRSLVALQWGQLADPGALAASIATKGLHSYMRKEAVGVLERAGYSPLFRGIMRKFQLAEDEASLSLYFRGFEQLQTQADPRITLLPDKEAKFSFDLKDVRFVAHRPGSRNRLVFLRPEHTPPLGPMICMTFSKFKKATT